MSRSRRALGLLIAVALAVPGLAIPFLPRLKVSQAENRVLAASPAVPATLADWRQAPRKWDAFIADHFAFREPLIRLNRDLFGRVGGRGDAVLEGARGRLFLSEGLLRSTGQEVDPARAEDYATFVCDAARRLRARGARVAFAVAPSPAAIYPEDAPASALPLKSPTEYDLLLEAAAVCGQPGLDLRPSLQAAKGQGQLYRRTDTHWTPRGALIAYNALVAAMGEPAWRSDPDQVAWTTVLDDGGDLLRLSGRPPQAEPVVVTDRTVPPPAAVRRTLEGLEHKADAPFVLETGRAGPTVLIVGDSYTLHYFPGLFAPHVGRVAWVHQDGCAFDWRIVSAVQPDLVLILPVERFAACPGGARPKHLDEG